MAKYPTNKQREKVGGEATQKLFIENDKPKHLKSNHFQ